MATGYLALVLHAHLPYVRHPEDATVMEEQWLYEAITGTYLPLIQLFEGLLADGVRARATVSLSAPLINMLTDDLLKTRYAERRVVATWEMVCSWAAKPTNGTAGASAHLGTSDLRLRGASEVFFVGASELRFSGASEARLVGASERLRVGASEHSPAR